MIRELTDKEKAGLVLKNKLTNLYWGMVDENTYDWVEDISDAQIYLPEFGVTATQVQAAKEKAGEDVILAVRWVIIEG